MSLEQSERPRARDAVLLVDLENLVGGMRTPEDSALSMAVLLTALRSSLETAGLSTRFAVQRVYANWSDGRLRAVRQELQQLALEPVQIFCFSSQQKNAADIELVCDALSLASDHPRLTTFVLVTGDGGYVPMIRRLHLLDRTVAVFSIDLPGAGRASRSLPAAADHFAVLDLLHDDEARPDVRTGPGEETPEPDPEPLTVERLLDAIRLLLETRPALIEEGLVDAGLLGTMLQRRFGSPVWKELGYDKLGRLLKANGWSLRRPPAKADVDAATPADGSL